MPTTPTKLTLRSYGVGFGDCHLLSFTYARTSERHVLIDFGSKSQQTDAGPSRMLDIAADIKKVCGGKLTAVVATHRHADHISGFTTGTGGKQREGDIIRGLKPDLVLQPWTETPDLATDAQEPIRGGPAGASPQAFAAMYASMQEFSADMLTELNALRGSLAPAVAEHLSFVGEDAITNPAAVKNLMTMGPGRYLSEGQASGLDALLPGVKTYVLGPPTVKQSNQILKEAPKEPGDYWKLQAMAAQFASRRRKSTDRLFPSAKYYRGAALPIGSRWFVQHARRVRSEQLLALVRILDGALNNTSLILLFEIAGKRFLFPGDAQIENWSWALSQAKYQALLRDVDLYKVGHHGSRNATPPALWQLFAKRSKSTSNAQRLTTVLSTKPGVYGKESNASEVPRTPLLQALKQESTLHATTALTQLQLCVPLEFTFSM